ncbi:hypothetical protein CC86DRAFT_415106 [Ophiobolus disseminans]|uniref:Uncharacterized protein n=1 Tax=Ophiobolus disseminans TaxID=1469910 RepID=A0A6A7AKU8_9PLEO|nr:hypothetical protein CC86DRAFT_415106 [Ophiobolus disseminans]
MPRLQGSRWAVKSSNEASVKDSKSKEEFKHIAIPSFGFQMPKFTPVTSAPMKQVPKPAPVRAQGATTKSTAPVKATEPLPAPQVQAVEPSAQSSVKITEPLPAPKKEAADKPFDRAGMAAARARARMAEIMGPRRR